jgi:cobalamin-dependent methionine synthase I
MQIERQEVLRYLGYRHQTLDEAMEALLQECMAEIKETLRKSYVYENYPVEIKGYQVQLLSTTLTLPSKDLSRHLQNAERCVLMAATLGRETDQKIAYYSRFELTKALIMDACATTAIEALCDDVQNEVAAKAKQEGYTITNRYSPGYGDLSLVHQKDILQVLNTYPRIGLTVNENHLMLPRKSVTAFIGLEKGAGQNNMAATKEKCNSCLTNNCRFRRGGETNE